MAVAGTVGAMVKDPDKGEPVGGAGASGSLGSGSNDPGGTDVHSPLSQVVLRAPKAAPVSQSERVPVMFIGVPLKDPKDPIREHLSGVTLDLKVIYDMRHHPNVMMGTGTSAAKGPCPMSAYWHVGAVEVEVAKEALIAYFESVKGRGAIVMYSGHGDGTGSWCMTDGRISYLDVLHWWQGVDATTDPKDENYHLGTLTVIPDCCHSGQ